MNKSNPIQKETGQILMISVVFMFVVLLMVTALVGYAAIQGRSHRNAVAREKALHLAEAGIERAIWKMNNVMGYSGETNTVLDPGTYNVVVTNLSPSTREVVVEAFVPNSTTPQGKRKLKVLFRVGTTNVGFNYGLQVGLGGLEMDNNSEVSGNIYSNGNIDGAPGATITGDVIVAGPTGTIDEVEVSNNSYSHFIEDSTVGGNASHYSLARTSVTGMANVDTMSDCTVGGDAFYNSKFMCTISGVSTTPNTSVPPDPASIDLPITDAQIDDWQDDAASGGVVGSQTISGTQSLGPKKISGNLTVSNNATLIITGTVWVTGNITFGNNSIIRLNAAYGPLSGLVIAGEEGSSTAGTITPTNNTQILGSGTAGSYLMMLSRKSGTASTAINVVNNATGAIFYAGDGLIDVAQNAGAKEITAYKVKLEENAVVTYETGLASAMFTTGPSGGWELMDQSWQEVK
jgi:hypothetical protein